MSIWYATITIPVEATDREDASREAEIVIVNYLRSNPYFKHLHGEVEKIISEEDM